MLLMLGSPIFLYLMAHILFPEREGPVSLDDYYFEKARLLWPLVLVFVLLDTLTFSHSIG